MKIIITGVTGFVGQNLTPLLKKKGYFIIGMDISGAIHPEISNFLDEYRQINLLNREEIANKLNDANCVIHLAGEASVNAKKNQLKLKNELITANLVEALNKKDNQKIIFLSSNKINKNNYSYSKSKIKAENKILINSNNSDLKYTILRCSTIYGKGMKSNLMRWLEKVKMGSIHLLPSSDSEISMIGIDDLCQIIIGCIENIATDNKTYLVTDGINYKINDIESAARNYCGTNKSKKIMPKWFIYIGSKIGDIIQLAGINFPINSNAFHMFFNNKAKHNPGIYNDLGMKPKQNFLVELQSILTE